MHQEKKNKNRVKFRLICQRAFLPLLYGENYSNFKMELDFEIL